MNEQIRRLELEFNLLKEKKKNSRSREGEDDKVTPEFPSVFLSTAPSGRFHLKLMAAAPLPVWLVGAASREVESISFFFLYNLCSLQL